MSTPGEYLKMRYMGDCKCGDCQLVPTAELHSWEKERHEARAALAHSRAEQIRLSLQVSVLTNERDEARALGRLA